MKNIILLPTEQESRLFTDLNNDLGIRQNIADSNRFEVNQNLYITSENKIKLDEPYLGEDNNIYYLCEGGISYKGKKIILTTDQTLIDNGIQPIDEEFLQWYANNGSCEFVEIEEYNSFGVDNWKYLITIPQDLGEKHNHEGKALTSEEVMEGRSSAYEFIDFKVSPKKEVLEKIKFVLLSNNDAQAIRIIEQYGFWEKENYREDLKTEVDKISLSNENINSWGDGFEYAIQQIYKVLNS